MTQAGKPREPAHPLERLIFFSDAVFAIAITLLVIEISVPHLSHGASDIAHVAELAELIPEFIGFFISFAVIGAFWSGHHRAFSLASHYAPGLIVPNMAMLCAVAFMPFATAYMSGNFGEKVPTAFYDAVLLVTGLLNLRLVRKVTGPPYVDETANAEDIAFTRARGWGVTGGAALALATSFVAPQFSQFALITIPLWIKLAIGRARRRLAA
jgi:uncharacterized membrane protein